MQKMQEKLNLLSGDYIPVSPQGAKYTCEADIKAGDTIVFQSKHLSAQSQKFKLYSSSTGKLIVAR